MTVQELIESLQSIEDKTRRVVVRGYEDGVDDIGYYEEINIRLNYYDQWYYGQHKEVYKSEDLEGAVPAVHLIGTKTYE